MALFDPSTVSEIRRRLAGILGPVRVLLFVDPASPEVSLDGETMLREVADICPQVKLSVYRRGEDLEVAGAYGVDRFPAIILEGPTGVRLRFFGLPRGYGFGVFFEGLRDAANGTAQADSEALRRLGEGPSGSVNIQVFVTPDCSLGPMAVRAAQRLAMEVPGLSADMIQAQDFPELARSYGVRNVPELVLNGRLGFEGAPSETTLADLVLRVASSKAARC